MALLPTPAVWHDGWLAGAAGDTPAGWLARGWLHKQLVVTQRPVHRQPCPPTHPPMVVARSVNRHPSAAAAPLPPPPSHGGSEIDYRTPISPRHTARARTAAAAAAANADTGPWGSRPGRAPSAAHHGLSPEGLCFQEQVGMSSTAERYLHPCVSPWCRSLPSCGCHGDTTQHTA
eukprot:COSAG01_NODE_2355_length_7841_cov_647.664815_9_plen_175_part_00